MSPTSYQTAPPRTHILAYAIPSGQILPTEKLNGTKPPEPPLDPYPNRAAEQFPAHSHPRGYNKSVPRPLLPALLALAAALSAQTSAPASAPTPFFPLKNIRPGMRGTGKTVFQGNRIAEFQVEILG